MTWNHRVLSKDGELAVYDVYYDEITGRVTSHGSEPMTPIGETLDELRNELELFAAALKKPVLPFLRD